MLPLCKCGCGKNVTKEKNKYINGHFKAWLGKKRTKETKLKISNSMKGIQHTDEQNKTQSKRMFGHHVSEETKLKISQSNKGKHNYLLGKKQTEETKSKISRTLMGHHVTEETKLKISKNNKTGSGPLNHMFNKKHSINTRLKMSSNGGNRKGIPLSKDHKFKLSLSAVKRLSTYGYSARRGRNEDMILDHVSKILGKTILRNDQNIANITGKYPDGYIPEYNLILEVLEDHHFKVSGELIDYDKERELILTSKLSCMIYYISERNYLNDPENEIRRIKEFIKEIDK